MSTLLNIYHVRLPERCIDLRLDDFPKFSYDKYSEFVVIAHSEEEARNIHPNGTPLSQHAVIKMRGGYQRSSDWISTRHAEYLIVTKVGVADESETQTRVLVASYHAG